MSIGIGPGIGVGIGSNNGGGGGGSSLSWQKVRLGGLGYVVGASIAADGSWILAKTDVGGFYRRASGDTAWQQVVGLPGFPSALRSQENYTTIAGNSYGCWECVIAPSNSDVAYAVFKAKVVKTVDQGITWAETNFAIVGGTSNDLPPNQQAFERLITGKMAVDPDDENTVLLWSPKTGMYRTTDGGTTWTQPTGLPAISGQAAGDRYGLIVCDEGSTVGSSRVWFAFGYGFGLYRSTDNGASWASAGAGYDTYTQASDLIYRSSGVVWVVDRAAAATEDNVRVWTQGSGYTSITSTPGGFKARYASINPANTNDITLSAGGSSGQFVRSQDGGTTWTAQWSSTTIKSQYTETRIMSYVQDQDGGTAFFWSMSKPQYHPTDGRLYWPSGYGMCYSTVASTAFNAPSSGDKLIIYDYAAGMEELVSVFGIILPDKIHLGSQDKSNLTITSPKTYALPAFPRGTALNNAYYIDVVESDTSKLAYASGGNLDGYSDDGGATGTTFTAQPLTGRGGGCILRFDDTHFIRFMGQNCRPRYTTDKGVTWNIPTFTAATLPADNTTNGFGSGLIDLNHRMAAKDLSNPGHVYCVNFGEGGTNTMRGCWKSTNYGATFTNQTNALILTSGTQNGHATLIRADGVLYYTAGSTGSGFVTETTNNYLFRSADDGVTWQSTLIANGYSHDITEALYICQGAPRDGSAFNTIYILGWRNHVFGIYYSTDKGLTWSGSVELPPFFDDPRYIAADPVTPGRMLLGSSGTGHWLRG